MGGWGSGPPKCWRGTVEETRSLDVLRFLREGMLAHPGGSWTWRWSNPEDGRELASIGVATLPRGDGLALRFFYKSTSQGGSSVERDYEVAIERTHCTFGGSRPWFRCPSCVRRSRFLYQDGSYYVCRECARLTYWSRRIHRDAGYETGWLQERIEKLYQRLFQARYPKRRAAIEARITILDRRSMAHWQAMAARLGIVI